MDRRKKLDLIINQLINKSIDTSEISIHDFELNNILSNNELIQGINYLEKLGFVKIDESSKSISITYSGRLFYEDTYFLFKSKPFGNQIFKKRLSSVWLITKTVGVIVNGLILLMIAYLSYTNTIKDNTLKNQIKTLEKENSRINDKNLKLLKERKIRHDSLNKRINSL